MSNDMNNNSTLAIYVSLVEVTPLDGCQLSPDKYGGATVRCYVAARTQEIAMERIAEVLWDNLFHLVNVEWCVDEASVEWESPNDAKAVTLTSEARTSKNVVFGEFHTWPPE